jgi:hypothetical protein
VPSQQTEVVAPAPAMPQTAWADIVPEAGRAAPPLRVPSLRTEMPEQAPARPQLAQADMAPALGAAVPHTRAPVLTEVSLPAAAWEQPAWADAAAQAPPSAAVVDAPAVDAFAFRPVDLDLPEVDGPSTAGAPPTLPGAAWVWEALATRTAHEQQAAGAALVGALG